jgi:ubiquinone/menaquinone biosynthesis C-methylase UbiE
MWLDELEQILQRPRGEQVDAVARLRERLPPPVSPELWNTTFGEQSLFGAWTSSSLMRPLYAANAAVLRPLLRPGMTVVEVGGGDGRLWKALPEFEGTLHVVDPAPEAHERVREVVGPQVTVIHHSCGVEQATLPDADVVVCSLTLHHVAGRDGRERARVGLAGSGKLEALQAMRAAAPLLILNEADVHCDVSLSSGSDALVDHMVDSYLRRAARALVEDWRVAEGEDATRLEAVIRHFCVEQIDLAYVPVGQRDVYELDVAHWLELLAAAGFSDISHRYTDNACLFVQYLAR